MARVDFRVHYAGPALEDGRMPINELAPALLGLSKAIQAIQESENPAANPISIDIKATERGSFIIDLILANGADLLHRAVDLFSGNETTAAMNVVGILGILTGGLRVIKRMAGHKVKSVDENAEGMVTIKLDDETSFTVPSSYLKAYQNIDFRKAVEQAVKPLKADGIESVEFSSTKTETVSIHTQEVTEFDSPQVQNEELQSTVAEVYLQLVSVAFEHGKWKFSDGSSQFFAKIEDEDFLMNVEKNEMQFGSTDSLKVRMRTTQTMTREETITAEHVVEKVLEHRRGVREIQLDFEIADNAK